MAQARKTMRSFTSHDLERRPGEVQDEALKGPVAITRDGQRLMLLSLDEYRRLQRRQRRVFLTAELSDEEVAAIAAAEPSPTSVLHDDEVEGAGG